MLNLTSKDLKDFRQLYENISSTPLSDEDVEKKAKSILNLGRSFVFPNTNNHEK